MKIKEIDRTAHVAWSPQHQHPIYLAAGTAAQQFDASFNTSAALELYALNLNDPGNDMGLKATVQSDHRFYKLTWGSHGQSAGTIVGGCDSGVIQIYNATKLLNGEKSLISQHKKHTGSVKALDFNSFQNNLLATGASESEIYIWDLNNPSTPMTPGSKAQPPEDINSIAWNRQVQHILASSFSTKCIVWDLRKNDPIIKLSDNTCRIRWSVVEWNPKIATQLCLGSEEDQTPVIQLWDLRFATSPLKILESHQKGVSSISWCDQDTDMMLSCGKDNKILCWNPNTTVAGEEVICEIASTNQWNFNVSWCPKNPALFVSSSFDGHVSVYSLVGGPQQVQTSNKIADSFPGMELYSQAPVPQSHQIPVDLRKAPNWLKRPVSAKFGFGGRLISFENGIDHTNEHPQPRCVHISQVVTEPQLVSRSNALQSTLQNGQYSEFCQAKIALSSSNHERNVWEYLAANFEPSPRLQFLNLLGFQSEDVNGKLAKFIGRTANIKNDVSLLSGRMGTLGRSTDSESELEGLDEMDPVRRQFTVPDELGLQNELNLPDSFDGSVSPSHPPRGYKISTGDDTDGLICQALLLGNIEAAVELCLQDNRMADAIILAMTGGSELLAKTQYRYFQQSKGYLSTLISAVVTEDWSQVIRNCDIDSWKEALAAAITHTNDQEFSILCEILGERLETEKQGALAKNAQICYICSGNLNKLVTSWMKLDKISSPNSVQDLVELVVILRKAVELQGSEIDISGRLAEVLSNYAILLASQGNLESALSYLGTSDEEKIAELRDRLNWSLGRSQITDFQTQQALQRRSSNQSLTGRVRTLSSGMYPHGSIAEPVTHSTAPVQAAFNLNPFQTTQASATNYQANSFSPGPPLASQQVPLSRSFPSPSPGPLSGGRAKHVVDPSVQALPSHPTTNSQFYAPNQFQPSVYPQTMQPTNNPQYNRNVTGYPPEVFNAPAEPTSPLPPPTVPKQTMMQQPAGWNDPPAVGHSRTTQPKEEYVPQNPITHPLLGAVEPDPPLNGHAPPFFDPYRNTQQQPVLQPSMHNPPAPNPSQYPPQMNPNLNQNHPNQQQYQNANDNYQQPKPKPVAPPPVIKPIPQEHAQLQSVFDELLKRCAMAANNPQSKRKLEEVSRKLEVLYDNLREERLSSNTLQGLHMISQHVQAGDYSNGLMLHTQLVSGPDFSQIAGFLPGIKVLLQSALQLQVYL